WLTLSATVAYLSLFDLMHMGAVNRLTQAYARGDGGDYRSVQRAAIAFYLSAAALGTLVITAVVLLVPLREVLSLTELSTGEVGATTWLLGCLILWAMPAGLLVATYRSTGNLAASQWVGNAQQAIT